MVMVVAVTVGLTLLAMWWRSSGQVLINLDQAAVVKEMQSLSRWETTTFTIEKIITAETGGNSLQQFFFGDKLLLIAHGKVVAGLDFGRVQPSDVTINGKDITVKLPPPEIFFIIFEGDKTKVFDRQTGLLTKGDKDLEQKARQAAELSIREAACQAGILPQAKTSAEQQMTKWLNVLGFERVTITIPDGQC